MRLTAVLPLLAGLLLSAPLLAAEAPAKTPSAAQAAQQKKMTTCNADAASKSLKGDERKTFMSSCLKAGSTSDGKTLTPQQQKMKDCNATAASKSLKGDERKTFMSTCLKKTA